MKNPIYDSDYEAVKKEAKEFYDKIGRVWCPAFNDYVAFRKAGFRHLSWKGGVFRFKGEQRRRFAVLPSAVDILQKKNSEPVYKKEGNAEFWAFTGQQDEATVRVIIRQINGGEKHFFSAFQEKQKSTR